MFLTPLAEVTPYYLINTPKLKRCLCRYNNGVSTSRTTQDTKKKERSCGKLENLQSCAKMFYFGMYTYDTMCDGERFCIYTHAQASLAINAIICSMAMSAHSQPVSSDRAGTQRNREAAANNTGFISAVCLVCLDRWTLDLRRHA